MGQNFVFDHDAIERRMGEIDQHQTFEDYIRSARDGFVNYINSQAWNTELRMEAENLLICFDQMREKIINHSKTNTP